MGFGMHHSPKTVFQAVQHDNIVTGLDELFGNNAADEAGSSSDQDFQECSSSKLSKIYWTASSKLAATGHCASGVNNNS